MTWTSALVTGASSGMGRCFAVRLAERGVDLVLVARSGDVLDDLARDLRARHAVDVEVIAADLTDAADLRRVADRLRDGRRPVDLLVNNAGIGTVGPLTGLPAEREEQVVRLDVLAVLHLARTAAEQMSGRGAGTIVNMASLAAYGPVAYFAVYSAAKAFVLNLSLALREELRGSGVWVTAVCPGFVDTAFPQHAAVRRAPLQRWYADPDRVVRRALRGAEHRRAVVLPGGGVRLAAVGARLVPPALLARMFSGGARTLGARLVRRAASDAAAAPAGPPPVQDGAAGGVSTASGNAAPRSS